MISLSRDSGIVDLLEEQDCCMNEHGELQGVGSGGRKKTVCNIIPFGPCAESLLSPIFRLLASFLCQEQNL